MIRIKLGVYTLDQAVIMQHYFRAARTLPQRHPKRIKSTIVLRKVSGVGGDKLRAVWMMIK